MTAKITLAQLEQIRACKSQVHRFEALFGTEVIVTPEAAVAVADQFDFSWAAKHLLSPAGYEALDEATAPARKAYDEAMATARKALDEAMVPVRKALNEARKALNEATAVAFATIYIEESQT